MNNLTGTYIDFIQSLGFIAIVMVCAYAVKQMMISFENKVQKVNVRIEKITDDHL